MPETFTFGGDHPLSGVTVTRKGGKITASCCPQEEVTPEEGKAEVKA